MELFHIENCRNPKNSDSADAEKRYNCGHKRISQTTDNSETTENVDQTADNSEIAENVEQSQDNTETAENVEQTPDNTEIGGAAGRARERRKV